MSVARPIEAFYLAESDNGTRPCLYWRQNKTIYDGGDMTALTAAVEQTYDNRQLNEEPMILQSNRIAKQLYE